MATPTKQVMRPPRRKLMWRGDEIRKIVGGRDDVCRDVDVECGHQQRQHRENHGEWISQARQNRDRIPESLAEDNQRGRRDGDSDERIKGHRRGEADRLTEHLGALASGVAREVRDVQGNGGPEADDSG